VASAVEAVTGTNTGEKRNYKLYNFRRPDKFSKDHLRALQTIHENFARQFGLLMTTYLRMSVDVYVVSVDQLTYDEFVHSMPSPMTVAIMQLAPLPGQILMGFGHEVTSSVIDRMLGGPGLSETKSRELTDIENLLIKRVIDRSIAVLTEAWGSVMEIEPKIIGMEDSYSLIQVATPGEIVALITFEIKLGKTESGLLSFCLPYPVLEGIIEQLSAQHIFHRQTADAPPDERDKVLSKLGLAKIPLQVYLGGATIKIAELLELQTGDVIKLNRAASDDLMVCVNQQPKFWARPGTLKNNLAVYINNVVQDTAELEYFGLKEH
jgi:flagellar motor switch protein FliM